MDSGLLQFHLKCAVLRNMKAAAEPIEDFSSECNDELDEVAQMLLKYTDLSAETVSAGLNWWVLVLTRILKHVSQRMRRP